MSGQIKIHNDTFINWKLLSVFKNVFPVYSRSASWSVFHSLFCLLQKCKATIRRPYFLTFSLFIFTHKALSIVPKSWLCYYIFSFLWMCLTSVFKSVTFHSLSLAFLKKNLTRFESSLDLQFCFADQWRHILRKHRSASKFNTTFGFKFLL